jgi:DNA invertase Pin-like site-specific DNA recombinase
VTKTFEHIKQLRGYGVEYISFSEPHFRTIGPAGELMMAVATCSSEQEYRRIGELTKAGLAKARRPPPHRRPATAGSRLRPARRA